MTSLLPFMPTGKQKASVISVA
jgi:hypothetical protein